MKEFFHSRWVLILPAFLVVACGVPITAAEISATAEVEQSAGVQGGQREQSFSSSEGIDTTPAPAAPASATNATPSPALAVIGTAEPTPTPEPDDTPAPPETVTASPTPAPPSSTPTAAPSVSPTPDDNFPQRLVALLNQLRADRGLTALRIDPNLTKAAQGYAQYMAENNYFGHTGLDGSTPNSRMIAAGYTAGCKGEAISAGQTTPDAALNAWLRSPAHFTILMEPEAIDIGLGYFFRAGTIYGHYWVLNTGPAAFPCA